MSIAAGAIGPRVSSWIHRHPAVTQVTYVVSGQLLIWMKEEDGGKPYSLRIRPGQAVVSQPGTLFQLCNEGDEPAQVLYIVSPSYVFEMDGDTVVYDDAILVARTWDEFERAGGDLPGLRVDAYQARAERAESERRIAASKGIPQEPLENEDIRRLPESYDYLAPDGSEIRLLVEGGNGGFAHCVLPAGRTSAPVRHRTVEELWYVLGGEGQVWRGLDDAGRVDLVREGDSLRIPVGTAFQFRAGEKADLRLLLATMPTWPGPQEAVDTQGEWTPNSDPRK
ncbi:MAG: cupin domain-containing protein [bacterium]|nr:cupin domain-containing protein [bacterium]